MKKQFFLSSIALLSLGVLAGCGGGAQPSGQTDLGTIKVWAADAVQETTQGQLDKFAEAHPEYKITWDLRAVGEGAAATDMIKDKDTGADVYFFAQDQLSRLVNAGALVEVNASNAAVVRANNDEGSVGAATIVDTEGSHLYAYPATSDNGYFMYYDKAVFGDNCDMTDLDAIVAVAKTANKKIAYNYTSAWYNAAFFLTNGAYCNYTLDVDGNYIAVDDTYDSPEGLEAAASLQSYISDPVFVDSSDAAGSFNSDACVCISGTWDANAAAGALGDNLGVAKLPRVTMGGQKKQLSSFAGFKLVGVKPQVNRDRAQAVAALALWLTNEASQLERFQKHNWGPSNKADQNLDEVKNNAVLSALFAQNASAKPQGQYPDGWWSLAGAIGSDLSVAGSNVQTVIQAYKDGLPATLNK